MVRTRRSAAGRCESPWGWRLRPRRTGPTAIAGAESQTGPLGQRSFRFGIGVQRQPILVERSVVIDVEPVRRRRRIGRPLRRRGNRRGTGRRRNPRRPESPHPPQRRAQRPLRFSSIETPKNGAARASGLGIEEKEREPRGIVKRQLIVFIERVDARQG